MSGNDNGITATRNIAQTNAIASNSNDSDDSDYDYGSDDLAGWDVAILEKAENEAIHAVETAKKAEEKKKQQLLPEQTRKSPPKCTHNVETPAVHDVLNFYTEEFTCHICQELMVAPYVANSCGHTIGCGQCARTWINKHKFSPSCSECREELPPANPIAPNFSLNQTIEHHVEFLLQHNVPGWDRLGIRRKEWKERADQWNRDQVRKREAGVNAARQQPVHQNYIVALAYGP